MSESPLEYLVSETMLRQRAIELAIQALGERAAADPQSVVDWAGFFLAFMRAPSPPSLERAA